MNPVHFFGDYKSYLLAVEEQGELRAFRSQLAKAAGCQNAYISQVLNGSQNFSLEQAEGVTELLSLTPEEKQFFMLLVQHARAGTPSLRRFFSEQIRAETERRLSLRNRVNTGESLSDHDQAIYYSDWYFSAIHVLVTISRFRTREAIAERLHLPLATVKTTCDFLISCGLLKEKNGELVTGRQRLYLSGQSPFIGKHHTNWRIHALQSLSSNLVSNLHYSSVVTISLEDSEKIREILIQSIKTTKEIISSSPEEDIFSFAIDFYRL